MMDHSDCVMGSENRKEIEFLKRETHDIKRDIHEIKNDLLKRPSWAVSMMLTILSSATVGAFTFAFTAFKMLNGIGG